LSAFPEVARKQGNLHVGIGIAMVVGLLAVLAIGAAGVPAFGIFTLQSALFMAAGAIIVLGAAQLASVIALRSTMKSLALHEARVVEATKQSSPPTAAIPRYTAVPEMVGREATGFPTAARIKSQESSTVFGQVHPVRSVEGVGPYYSNALASMGVENTRQLWEAYPAYVAGRLAIATKTVENWQCMCELMAVNGIGPQYAELLLRAGVRSIPQLQAESPETLLRKIEQLEGLRERRVQRNPVGTGLVDGWIEAARMHEEEAPATP
jgi:predicted flap endonuclease-1-like 5' DNA nuclease